MHSVQSTMKIKLTAAARIGRVKSSEGKMTNMLANHHANGLLCLGSGETHEGAAYDRYGRPRATCTVCMMSVRLVPHDPNVNALAVALDQLIEQARRYEREHCAALIDTIAPHAAALLRGDL